MTQFCCDQMKADLTRTCADHPKRADCPDALVAEMRGGYGLMLHDGGSSLIEIAFCPWCGTKLPSIAEPVVAEPATDEDDIEAAGRDAGC